ncbi:hypothetical protein [Nocardia sp. bgisy134]|uniref:hypothetical protein n=1 Tax=Nocardia sp. bgisy134 TaxID=3413789 RepID=UPI003D7202E2
MVSWRDTASEAAQGDLDGLLDTALTMAEQRLSERGEFYPFALVVNRSGGTEIVAAGTGSAQHAQELNVRAVVGMRAEIRAAALVVDVRLPESGGDGIDVHLEHAEGTALSVLEPYRVEHGEVIAGGLEAFSAQRRIWQ